MLRAPPTEITLTINDISKATEGIATRRKATAKARIRQGAERSRDEAIRTSSRIPSLPRAMRAICISAGDLGRARRSKFLLPSIEGSHRRRQDAGFVVRSESSECEASVDTPERLLSQLLVPAQSGIAFPNRDTSLSNGIEISQLHLDGADDDRDHALSNYARLEADANLLCAPVSTSNRQRQEYTRSPLYQSQMMSSPNISTSTGSAQAHVWSSRQQFPQDSIEFPQYSSGEYLRLPTFELFLTPEHSARLACRNQSLNS
jgi:hypothetical protein